MANEYIIKEWTSSVIGATTNLLSGTDIINSYSNASGGPGPINGQILEVQLKSNLVGGSLSILQSGTNQEIFRRNAPSGIGTSTGWQFGYPRVFGELTTGSVTAATMTEYLSTGPLIINVAGSATTISGGTVQVKVRYR